MNEFADWLSPIAVKELRQGMRTFSFVGVFLAMQVCMIGCFGIAWAEGASVGPLFWTAIAAMLLVGLPLQGVFSVSKEIKGNTMELLLLTQLSARKILVGKWVALIVQCVLLTSAIFPYVVLRYFLGGVDLAFELAMISLIFGGSVLFSGVAVAVSPFMMNLLPRLGLGLAVWGLLSVIFGMRAHGFVIGTWHEGVVGLLIVTMLMLEMLEFGVTKIAPPGESNAARKRLLALVGVAIVFGAFWTLGLYPKVAEVAAIVAAVLAAPVCFAAWFEPVHPIPSLYRAKLPRSGWPSSRIPGGKWVMRLFYPGWVSGLVFSFLMAALIFGLGNGFQAKDEKLLYFLVVFTAILLLPLAVGRLFFRPAWVGGVYFAIQGISFALGPIVLALLPKKSGVPLFAYYLPATGFSLSLSNRAFAEEQAIVAASVVIFLSLIALLIAGIRDGKLIAEMERRAATA